ncbi:hypothetical protein FB45DRAFT_883800 [Roridomyces roridus]|uniref:Uncharacterized protein n=1 Tax=Roridomyces roridus TaxID=1738132 RepID=A0AAD7AWP7_9AGAR|nr:hypothetical protein FB45DRAFT_883800 [Roridomyces roridus]
MVPLCVALMGPWRSPAELGCSGKRAIGSWEAWFSRTSACEWGDMQAEIGDHCEGGGTQSFYLWPDLRPRVRGSIQTGVETASMPRIHVLVRGGSGAAVVPGQQEGSFNLQWNLRPRAEALGRSLNGQRQRRNQGGRTASKELRPRYTMSLTACLRSVNIRGTGKSESLRQGNLVTGNNQRIGSGVQSGAAEGRRRSGRGPEVLGIMIIGGG